ncbi:hypothetical protein V8D89_008637 [Ganoderma adspersum]
MIRSEWPAGESVPARLGLGHRRKRPGPMHTRREKSRSRRGTLCNSGKSRPVCHEPRTRFRPLGWLRFVPVAANEHEHDGRLCARGTPYIQLRTEKRRQQSRGRARERVRRLTRYSDEPAGKEVRKERGTEGRGCDQRVSGPQRRHPGARRRVPVPQRGSDENTNLGARTADEPPGCAEYLACTTSYGLHKLCSGIHDHP